MTIMIVGFVGLAGSGKSTAAAALSAATGAERVRFAGPLKAMLAAIGLSEEEIEGAAKESPSALLGGRTPRHAMQTLGTEWGRRCMGEDFWVDLWSGQAADALSASGGVIAEDVRFANEAAAIHALGGVVIRIDRPGHTSPGGSHASEAGAAEITPDAVVRNDGTPADLLANIRDALRWL